MVLAGEPNLEQIASLAPDVIIAVSAGTEQQMYDQLSAIAPAVARPAGTIAYGVPRDEHTRIVAAALGEPEPGEELIRQADPAFSDAVPVEQPARSDEDVLVMLADEGAAAQQVAGDAVPAQVPVVTQDRMVVPDADTRGAMTYNSVRSAPFVLERLVPELQTALGS